MSDETYVILCGHCHRSLEQQIEFNGDIWAVCSVCGQEDRVSDIQREAAEYHAAKAFGEMIKRKFRRTGNLILKMIPRLRHRWITVDKTAERSCSSLDEPTWLEGRLPAELLSDNLEVCSDLSGNMPVHFEGCHDKPDEAEHADPGETLAGSRT